MSGLIHSFLRWIYLNYGWKTAFQIKQVMLVTSGIFIGIILSTVFLLLLFLKVTVRPELNDMVATILVRGNDGEQKNVIPHPRSLAEALETLVILLSTIFLHRKSQKTFYLKSPRRAKIIVFLVFGFMLFFIYFTYEVTQTLFVIHVQKG